MYYVCEKRYQIQIKCFKIHFSKNFEKYTLFKPRFSLISNVFALCAIDSELNYHRAQKSYNVDLPSWVSGKFGQET